MGLHLGEAEERGSDYFGPVVNTAARVEAAGHGGQVLITDAVRTAAGVATADLTDLGMRNLRDVAEPLHLFQLGTDTFAALRVIDQLMSNLPVRPTRLIGREIELGRIRGLLAESRLVTITAVGGSGKTRLAIAVGEAELHHYRSGVWFVDLTAVSSGAEVPGAIANGLGLNLISGDPTKQILTFLADKPALVILDNCEHLIDESAAFVDAFLATNNPAKILATSREALDIDGERVVVLGSLATDTADSPGVRLFVDCATAVHPEFTLTDSNAATVSTICARLDGMPLAIELAAARITVMNPDELLAGLDQRFQLLSGGRRRSRQRNLEATLDWSYDLLEPDEQSVFRTLGVFVDGFDLDAVAAVTGLDRRRATPRGISKPCRRSRSSSVLTKAKQPVSGSLKPSRPTPKTDSSTPTKPRTSVAVTSRTSTHSPCPTAAECGVRSTSGSVCVTTAPTLRPRSNGPPTTTSGSSPENFSPPVMPPTCSTRG